MPIDPEKIRGGKDDTQINVRVSPAAEKILDYLVFVDGFHSRNQLLLDVLGQVIENAAPSIREVINKPEYQEVDLFRDVLGALNKLCPPEAAPPEA